MAVSGSLQADVIVLFVQSQLHCMTFVVLLRFRALFAERRAQKELHIAQAVANLGLGGGQQPVRGRHHNGSGPFPSPIGALEDS